MSSIAVPEDLLRKVRAKSSRQEGTRFPHKLFHLLSWAGSDPDRGRRAGCGWVTDAEFFVEKSVLNQTLDIKQNTLSVNLTQLGFQQTRQMNGVTFWMRDGFSRHSQQEDLDAIRSARVHPERGPADPRVLYLALLEPLQLWGLSPDDTANFRRAVLADWDRVAGGAVVFGIAGDAIRARILRDAGRSDCAWLFEEALTGITDIFAFAVLLARFGPWGSMVKKITQYRAVVRTDLQAFVTPPFAQHFAPTFHNCFRLPLPPDGEFHCYNLPGVDDGEQFLADEDGRTYGSWERVVEENRVLLARYRTLP
jgi:hypothetical protein